MGLTQCAVGRMMDAESAMYNLTQTKLQKQGFDSVRALPGCQEFGGCRHEEMALYNPDQLLPTHIVHFRLSKSGSAVLAAQQLSTANLVKARDYTLECILRDLVDGTSGRDRDMDHPRISACKKLGDMARDDQRKATAKFLSNRNVLAQLTSCARSPNEALQFEALRAWWNFSFNDQSNQSLTMQTLGAGFLTSLLEVPNRSLQRRGIGLIWNLTQNDAGSRLVFAEAGAINKLGAILCEAQRDVMHSVSPPWGLLQLTLGALANLAMSCAERLRMNQDLVQAGQYLLALQLVAPLVVYEQSTRLLCNIISEGTVDAEWQANSYSYRSSAPRDGVEVA